MTDACDPCAANFSGSSTGGRRVFVGRCSTSVHRPRREGTEAAAATSYAAHRQRAARDPVAVTVDHPFLFFIRHRERRAPLRWPGRRPHREIAPDRGRTRRESPAAPAYTLRLPPAHAEEPAWTAPPAEPAAREERRRLHRRHLLRRLRRICRRQRARTLMSARRQPPPRLQYPQRVTKAVEQRWCPRCPQQPLDRKWFSESKKVEIDQCPSAAASGSTMANSPPSSSDQKGKVEESPWPPPFPSRRVPPVGAARRRSAGAESLFDLPLSSPTACPRAPALRRRGSGVPAASAGCDRVEDSEFSGTMCRA